MGLGAPWEIAIRLGPWKLLANALRTNFELYNLDQDPGETLDLSATETQRVLQMTALLNARYAGVNGDLPAAANTPPTAQIVAPATGAVVATGADLLFEATASDPDGTITEVEFFEGWTSLGAVSAAPYQITWPAVPSGTYTLTARATDDAGATAVSADVIVSVTPGGVLPSPGRRRAGGCGATGIEVVIPLILVLARPRRRKPRRS